MKNQLIYLNSNDGGGWLAFGGGTHVELDKHSSITAIQDFIDANKGTYLFTCLSYDLKAQLADIPSENFDGIRFPMAVIWQPEFVVRIKQESITFVQGKKDIEALEFINRFLEEETDQHFHRHHITFTPRIDRETYLSQVRKIKEHIQHGDTYEVNFCQEFYAEDVELSFELDTYFKLNAITRAPFSAFVNWGDFSVFCGSPERFIKREGEKLMSQPIKGTAKRGNTVDEDELLKQQLQSNPKERAENIMIVDLVRNDLSQLAQRGSVAVDELCAIKTVETVHQMYSTVSCTLKEQVNFQDILKATFPMGSMTGAPKKRTMELIETYESFQRGLFSGSIGLIEPDGNFDLNVVIRTLIYNKKRKYLSCAVGSAITAGSIPEMEYEECMLKINRILEGINA